MLFRRRVQDGLRLQGIEGGGIGGINIFVIGGATMGSILIAALVAALFWLLVNRSQRTVRRRQGRGGRGGGGMGELPVPSLLNALLIWGAPCVAGQVTHGAAKGRGRDGGVHCRGHL